jgi:hypothetical protein
VKNAEHPEQNKYPDGMSKYKHTIFFCTLLFEWKRICAGSFFFYYCLWIESLNNDGKESHQCQKNEQSLHLTPLNLQKTTNFVVENPCKIHVTAWDRQQNVGLIGSKPYPCLFTHVLSNYHCLTFLFIKKWK